MVLDGGIRLSCAGRGSAGHIVVESIADVDDLGGGEPEFLADPGKDRRIGLFDAPCLGGADKRAAGRPSRAAGSRCWPVGFREPFTIISPRRVPEDTASHRGTGHQPSSETRAPPHPEHASRHPRRCRVAPSATRRCGDRRGRSPRRVWRTASAAACASQSAQPPHASVSSMSVSPTSNTTATTDAMDAPPGESR